MKKLLLLMLAVLSLLTFAGCGEESAGQTLPPVYIVEFHVGQEIYSKQYIEVGYTPREVKVAVSGASILGWLDESGAPVDPFTTAVTESVVYTAQLQVPVTEHARFLFMDEEGHLRPDDALTGGELFEALAALAPTGISYFPAMPEETATVDGDTLWQILQVFFPEEAPRFSGSEAVSRAAFAEAMVELLERQDEPVELRPDTMIPVDVYADHPQLFALYEATVSHRELETGASWEQVKAPLNYAPGLMHIDGWLYCVGEDRQFVKNASVDGLYFGADGRYTCGNAQLDEYVAEVLAQLMDEDPNAANMTLLRRAYEYCRDREYVYRDRGHAYAQTGWILEDGLFFFENDSGDSYDFAAAFCALARGLGYDATAVSGAILERAQIRGFAVIHIDGVDYVFDPEKEMDYRVNWDTYVYDMFMMDAEYCSQWIYEWEAEA